MVSFNFKYFVLVIKDKGNWGGSGGVFGFKFLFKKTPNKCN